MSKRNRSRSPRSGPATAGRDPNLANRHVTFRDLDALLTAHGNRSADAMINRLRAEFVPDKAPQRDPERDDLTGAVRRPFAEQSAQVSREAQQDFQKRRAAEAQQAAVQVGRNGSAGLGASTAGPMPFQAPGNPVAPPPNLRMQDALDNLQRTTSSLEEFVGQLVSTVQMMLPPDFRVPDIPQATVPNSSACVTCCAGLTNRLDSVRTALSIIVSNITL